MAGITKAERERRAAVKAANKVDEPAPDVKPVDAVANVEPNANDDAEPVKGDDVVGSPDDAVDHSEGAPASPGGAVSVDNTPPVTTQADGSVGFNERDEAEAFKFDRNAFGADEAERRRTERLSRRESRMG